MPRLPCVEFLQQHFEDGRLDQRSYEILLRMIEMMSAISMEVHLVYQSKIPTSSSTAYVQYYLGCIGQGCTMFHEPLQRSLDQIPHAPEASAATTDNLAERPNVTQKRFLACPVMDDARLFRLLYKHYKDSVYQRLHQLHECKPAYGLHDLVLQAVEVQNAFRALVNLTYQAVRQSQAAQSLCIEPEGTHDVPSEEEDAQPEQLLQATVYHPPTIARSNRLPPEFSKSFTVAEAELARRHHARAATVGDSPFSTSTSGGHIRGRCSRDGAVVGIRHKPRNVPRVFTGSFSQLEEEIRKFRIHKIETPELPPGREYEANIKVRDFGTSSPEDSCTPSRSASLQRREAIVRKETEIQERIIRGEVFATRRPSNREREQPVDNASGLEAWLQHASSTSEQSLTSTQAVVRRGNLRQREHTL